MGDPITAMVDLLCARHLRLGAAESLTGGLLGVAVARCMGAGEVFRGSIVAYASDVKYRLLEVAPGPVVSAGAAATMATSARRLLDADVAVSLTGVAGPDTQDGEPVGTVFVGVASGGGADVTRLALSGSPDRIRDDAVTAACEIVSATVRVEV